ncbi:hypothetical protein [Candidatus Poriferisodalis sp.]|uniref:hypothetical protein n=1 Tax=Candidatus Poriferisodalis sp. TaxID=3101277 RepID=UPI003B5AE300
MSRIEVLLSEDFHRLLRKLADAEQSTTSECARTLIETVLRQLDDRVSSVDEEALKAQFADFAREYPALRRELFDADADLRLDEPTAPSAESGGAIPSSSGSSSADDGDAALTGHLADRHVYAMAVRIPRDAKPDSDVVTMASMLEPHDWTSSRVRMLSKYIVHMYLAGDEPFDGPLIVYPQSQPDPRSDSARA